MKFATTGSQELPRHLKVLVTGSPKSGKTTFLGTVPGILIADTEAGANNLQSVAHLNVPFTTITSSDDLRQLLLLLRDEGQRKKIASNLGVPSIEAVAIDTLDSYQEILKRERLAEVRQKQFKRDDWSWLLEQMTAMINAFNSLPMHVLFTVHTKVQNLGSDDDPRSIILPSLSGQMAERLAGMVGYSLATFRRDEVDPSTGNPRTVYLLRTEGDEVHPTLGNRSAGTLPAVIWPQFQALLDSMPAPLAAPAPQVSTEVSAEVEPPAAPMAPAAPAAEAPAAVDEAPALDKPPLAAVPSEPVAAPAEAETQAVDQDALNEVAISHLTKMWKAIGLPSTKNLFGGMTLTQAREAIVMWNTLQHDYAEGNCEDPVSQMVAYVVGNGWASEPKKRKPRKVASAPEPAPAPEPVPAPAPATEPAPEPAVALVEKEMGAKVVEIREKGSVAPCDECGNPIDDADIAALGKNRFGKWLCVDDYRAAAKANK